MKKIISISLLALCIGIFLGYSSYTSESFNYHTAQFIGYLFYWSIALFVISLFAFILDIKKYKIWLLLTGIYTTISILIAWNTGDGNGAILSFDGKDLTLIFVGFYVFFSIIYFIIQFIKKHKS